MIPPNQTIDFDGTVTLFTRRRIKIEKGLGYVQYNCDFCRFGRGPNRPHQGDQVIVFNDEKIPKHYQIVVTKPGMGRKSLVFKPRRRYVR